MSRHYRNFEFGSWNADTLTGTDGRDYIFAFGGNDTITSGAGNDVIFAGSGDDVIDGGAGNDTIFGGFGFDTAQYSGSIEDYSISVRSWWGPTVVTAVDPSVEDAGRDKLYSVEALYFAADDYTLFLNGMNNAVLAGDDTASTSENAALTITADTLLANDREFDGDTIAITSVSATSAAGANVTFENGEVSYDPGALFEHLGAGETATDTFTYVVDDGNGGTDTATVTVTITGENDAPNLLTVDQVCLIEGNSTFQTVISADDPDGDTLTFSLSGDDAALFTVDAETGAISFIDAPDVSNPLDTGGDNTYDLELTVSDGTESTTRSVAVQVVPTPNTGNLNVVAFDMVGSASQGVLNFVNTAPDFSSAGDGFGFFQVGAGSVPFSLVDDSAGSFPSDDQGIIDGNSNTDVFFGVTDTQNNDNDGDVSATWSFDISGADDLSLSVDVGAMGDFETSDSFSFTYNIDDGAEISLFDFVVDEAASLDYTLAGGSVETLNDPLTLAGSGETLSNILQTLTGSIEGTGSTLNLTFTANADGGAEAFAFQNLIIEGTGGTDEPEPPTYEVEALSGDVFEGDDGVTEISFEITRDGDISEAGSVEFTVGGDVDADDFGGVLPTGTVEFAAGQTCATITFEVNGDTVIEDDEAFTVTLSNPVGGEIVTESASVEVLDDDDLVLISDIQGEGAASELVDQVVTVEAVVTYVTSNGYFLQEEDTDSDGNAQTSEGIFVFSGGANQPAVGDLVVTRGVVGEFFGQTQLSQDQVRIVSSGNELPTAATVLLSGAAQNFEAIEGMRFTLDSGVEGENITVIENFNLDRFGEITVSAGVQTQPTQIFDAQTEAEDVAALREENENNRLIIDDGNSEENPDEFQYIPNTTSGDNGNGFLDAEDTFTEEGPTLRLGAELDGPTTGVMSFGFGEYRMLVEGTLDIDESTNSGAREETAPDVGGDIQVASVNVLNYFSTLRGEGGSGPNGLDPRGAGSETDLERQTDKLVDAMTGTGAEVFALQEIENAGFGADSAIATLVDALNEEATTTGSGANYAFVDPTTDAGFIGTDAITTGIVYDANAVSVVHSEFLVFDESSAATTFALAEVLNAVVPSDLQVGDFQRNRPAVAATFEDNETGETFTIVSNHFKSKGPSGLDELVEAAQEYLDGGGTDITQADIDALINDPNYDQGDGQAFWNQVRADAAVEIQNWIENDYMGGGVTNFIIMGDLNAYAQEDPVQSLTDDPGLVDLIDQFIGQDEAYSFVFDGQRGALDHAIASDDMAELITGAAEWHINADEPDLLNYNSAFNNANFFEDSRFASSDHDPLIIGIDTGRDDILVG
ncbi:hypothetical protein GCM10007385_31740 [Tateyamaria omphalii]|uniref:ExeM/NucH family extracellular endonuclease n=1 Tax=Tateyamaria omphalii TaxID=299262 RepID=UPI0016743808|nr:ExeM/NucH family extracellular endonuclease [Tateyamaria omphalii]GGX60133.1 hypothetical protein GCM10007385_31740 [Tateyamaria omphalii]